MKKIVLAFLAAAGILAADPMTVDVSLAGAGNPPVIAYNFPGYPGGVYIGPYQLEIGGQIVDALCVDPFHESNPGDHWTAAVSTVGGDISHTYNANNTANILGYNVNSSIGYAADAVLFYLIEQPNSDRMNLQEAAWTMFNSPFNSSDTANIQSAALQDFQNSHVDLSSFNFSNYQILTDVNGTEQEFIVHSEAPEPLSLGLLGAGLLGIGFIRFRRKSSKA